MYYKVEYLKRGKRESITVQATNKIEASSIVKRENKNIIVVKVTETSAGVEDFFKDLENKLNKLKKSKIKIDDKIAFIRQIAVMTDAGIPINDVLDDIVINSKNESIKRILSKVSSDINAGKSMSQALEPFKDELGHIVMAMTSLGEKTGNFPEAYHKLADILEKMRDNHNKFMKAIRYPIMVIVALILAFVAVIVFVVPKFKDIFKELGADLPMATKFLLSAESFFSNYGPYIIASLIAAFFTFKYFYKTNKDFKYLIDKILSNKRFYLIGNIVYLSNMYNYTLVLSSLIKAGIPVSEALQTSRGVVGNSFIQNQLESININIGRGISLSESFEQSGLFDNMLLQMVRAGESSGQLDKMLEKVRDYYDMRFQNLIDNLSAYIEPIMIAMIAGLVLLLALGIFMPMWDLGKAAQG